MTTDTEKPTAIWACKIGVRVPVALPPGCDAPMRQAVEQAFRDLTGMDDEFCFSGWSAELTEPELAVVENRLPSEEHYAEWKAADELDRLQVDLSEERHAHNKTQFDLAQATERLAFASAYSRKKEAELKTVLDREAETHRRHDVKVDALEAELAEARKALALYTCHPCPVCNGDCSSANPPVYACPTQAALQVFANEHRSKPDANVASGFTCCDCGKTMPFDHGAFICNPCTGAD